MRQTSIHLPLRTWCIAIGFLGTIGNLALAYLYGSVAIEDWQPFAESSLNFPALCWLMLAIICLVGTVRVAFFWGSECGNCCYY